MKQPTYKDFQTSNLPITDLTVSNLVSIIDVVVDKKLDEKLNEKLAPIYAHFKENEIIQNQILNALGTDLNSIDTTLCNHERRIAHLETHRA